MTYDINIEGLPTGSNTGDVAAVLYGTGDVAAMFSAIDPSVD